MPRRIPYAVADYEELVLDGYHYVDKTRFISELEKYKLPVFLRPRRFGKSLWCSMLQCYYDVNRADRFESLFGQTDIGRSPTPDRNSHLVIRFDFSRVLVSNSYAEISDSFDRECDNAFSGFLVQYGDRLPDGYELTSGKATEKLAHLLQAVKNAECPPMNIIIDEYDNFTNQLLTALLDELYRDVTTGESFLRTFFKTIKAGIGERAVARAFITGVLPITMDDLTSGFNVGQIVTLEEHVLEAMGFTQSELDAYVDGIFAEHAWDDRKRTQVRDELRAHYNGYRFLPQAETIYNATIVNFYLNSLVIREGKIPAERIDHNLRVDINWLRRLTGSEDQTRRLLETLMFEGRLPVDMTMLNSKFNMRQFFEQRFFPLSLFYLGMLSFEDEFSLQFPNLTVKTIFTEYFNEVENIEVSLGYTDIFRQFMQDKDLETLFAGYFREYVGQIPAQAFDKVNENFFRTTFYELFTRYMGRNLVTAIEVNHPSGRSDFEAVGRTGTVFTDEAYLIEFKHMSKDKGTETGILDRDEPLVEDAEQVRRYASDLKRKYPNLTPRSHVVYTVGSQAYRFFTLPTDA